MTFTANPNFEHSQPPRIGVLVTNLGTPDAPEKGPLRRYLREFLWDPRVVEIPRALWWLILHGVILRLRPARSAAAYRGIWTDQGSPLMVNTRAQAEALGRQLRQHYGEQVLVEFAMRYGQPDIAGTVRGMLDRGVDKLLVLPLYPQYSGPTTGSTFDAVAANLGRRRRVPDLRFVAQYHDHPAYIDALARSILDYREAHGPADRLVLSYHGEPRRCLDLGDPYFCQCHKTTRLVAEKLGLAEDAYVTTFQSRFGKAEWLQPYTDATLRSLPGSGVRSVQVICPGFSSDCLETLEEIAVENRDYFLRAGGERFAYIPCLNSDPGHIDALSAVIADNLHGWLDEQRDPEATRARAMALGATR